METALHYPRRCSIPVVDESSTTRQFLILFAIQYFLRVRVNFSSLPLCLMQAATPENVESRAVTSSDQTSPNSNHLSRNEFALL